MKREIIRTAAAALVLTLAPGGAAAQALVEIARREKARRATIAAEDRSKVYTNDDLRDSGGLTIGALPATTAPEAEVGAGRAGDRTDGREAAAGPDAGETLDENGWRTRMTTAQEARARAELTTAALQNRADGLWAQFAAMDDPARRRVVERQRTEALEELERSQAEAQRLEQQIGNIREEARRAGVPPGWLR